MGWVRLFAAWLMLCAGQGVLDIAAGCIAIHKRLERAARALVEEPRG